MRRLEIEWQGSEAELHRLWKREKHSEKRLRLRALYYLRQGKQIKEVSIKLGKSYCSLQAWVAWYRQSGLSAVLGRIKGHGNQGAPSYLSLEQEASLRAKILTGQLVTVAAVRAWVQQQWGIIYTPNHCLLRLQARSPVSKRSQRTRRETVSQQSQSRPWRIAVDKPEKALTASYPSDLNDVQWDYLSSMLPKAKAGGRPREICARRMLNAILCVVRTGCQWRYLPHDFPAWQTVYDYFQKWRRMGVWEVMHRHLRQQLLCKWDGWRHRVPPSLKVNR